MDPARADARQAGGTFRREVMLEVCIAKGVVPSAHFSRHCRPARGCRIAMSLRRQNLSPTANLLRNSRLFSLPNPLPRPPVGQAYVAGTQKVSDTATLPYPTHQAIATTPRSLARGDWGLKRPLPSRSYLVQTSDPVVKVKQLDSIEHITDFDSAADHVRTRQKFEELSIPMLRGMSAQRDQAVSSPVAGAFERWSDTTSYDVDKGLDEAGKILQAIKKSALENIEKRKDKTTDHVWTPYVLPQEKTQEISVARHNARRWKHEGPWVPGMSADEFTKYITRELSVRRKEFNEYLRHYVKTEIYTARAMAATTNLPDDPVEQEKYLERQESNEYHAEQVKEWSNISDDQISARIKKLRSEAAINPLQSTLVQRLIVPFLRIPTMKLKDISYSTDARSGETHKYRFDDDVAPLSTHPSAGLGYLRTNAYMANHPVLGPQGERAPVKARVLESRIAAREKAAKLGVAGFVTLDDHQGIGERHVQHQAARDPAYDIDIHTEGGAKLNVLPRFGSVSNDGRIHIKIKRAVGAEVQVANGILEDRPPQREGLMESSTEPLRDVSRLGKKLDEKSEEAQNLMEFVKANASPREAQSVLQMRAKKGEKKRR